MTGKSIKLIIGVVLFVIAILLYLFSGLSYWLAIAVAAIGLIFIILSFLGKEKLPAVTSHEVAEPTEAAHSKEGATSVPEESAVEVPPSPPSEPSEPSAPFGE